MAARKFGWREINLSEIKNPDIVLTSAVNLSINGKTAFQSEVA